MNFESKLLTTDIQLFAAALSGRKVSVMQRTADDIYVILEYGAMIERYSDTSVKINGNYYLRMDCEFTIE